MRRTLLLLVLLLIGVCSQAQKERPVSLFTSFEAGGSWLKESYLSPLVYKGWGIGLNVERERTASFGAGKWYHHNLWRIYGTSTHTAINGSGSIVGGWLSYRYALAYRAWSPIKNGEISIAPSIEAEAGGLLNLRNSNNPGSANLSIALGATLVASYNFTLGDIPCKARYQATLPVVNLFFMPQYGASYYETFVLGNTKQIVHVGVFDKGVALYDLLSVEATFSRCTVRIGMRNVWRRESANHLVSQLNTHSGEIGFGWKFITR